MSNVIKDLSDLRGERIELLPGRDEYDEIVDESCIVKRPLVSVHMMTYMHEAFIAKAIESVLEQEVDFDYELVIGEDCSVDATREICLSYQKRFPEKIRLLLSKRNSGIGINTMRVFNACRGEFIAYLEGDDYWIDSLKLQKQVRIMREHANIGLIFCGAKFYRQENDSWAEFDPKHVFGVESHRIRRDVFLAWTMYGRNPKKPAGDEFFVMTSGLFFRTSDIQKAMKCYDVFKWKLGLYDSAIVIAMGAVGDVYYLYDQVSVYRQMTSGLTVSKLAIMIRDTLIIRFYYHIKLFKLSLSDYPSKMMDRFAFWNFVYCVGTKKRMKWYGYFRSIIMNKHTRFLIIKPRRWIVWLCLLVGLKHYHRLGYYYTLMWPASCNAQILSLYKQN